MARRRDPFVQKQVRLPKILQIFLVFPYFLVAIGDAIIFLIQAVILIPVTTYNIGKNVTTETGHAAFHWLVEKVQKLKPRRPPGRPPQKYPRAAVFTRLTYRISQNLAQLPGDLAELQATLTRFALPKIVLPKLRLPRLALPFLSWPKIRLPQLSRRPKPPVRPKLALPKAYIVFPPPEEVIHKRLVQLKAFLAGAIVTILLVFLPFTTYTWLKALPNPALLSRRDLEVTTKIFDRAGVLLYEIYTDQNRTPLPLDEIPEYIKQATVAIEDRDFYRHQGVSLRGILRALREIVLHNRIQGGSTITQQLIKSALLTPEVKLSRKLKEIFLAFWAERIYTKDQILEMYLNQVPYGGTAWGIEAASQTYFGKSAKNITLGEAALLAGLPAAPSEYSPFGNQPQRAIERQTEVLRRMEEDGHVTREQSQQTLATPLQFISPRIAIRAPHFVMYVKELLESRYGPRLVERGGLRVVTSLDVGIQEKAQDVVRSRLEALTSLRVGNGAALVTNPKTGEILAMVGSKDYFNLAQEGNVNVTTALRQPGSSIKVVTYAAALEDGFTAATVLDDTPVTYHLLGAVPYTPVNYDGKFHGPTPLRYALGNSYNVPAVKVLAKLGVSTMIEKGKLMGIESWQDESRYGLSLTLGGGDVTMLEMAKVYGTLANQGRRVDLLPILEVTDYTGRIIERNQPKPGIQAVAPAVAWILGNILSDNVARISAFGPNSSLIIPGKTVAVKTGTSNDKRDNWTIGYTPSLTLVVWVGNNNNSPMDPYLTSGVTGAAPIWHDIMVELTRDRPDEVMPKPENVVGLPCHMGRLEYFVTGSQPAGGRCAPLPSPTPSPAV